MGDLLLIKWDEEDQEKTIRIIQAACGKWKELGGMFDIAEPVLQGLEKNSNQESCRAVLQMWLESGSQQYPSRWCGLINALEDVELKNLAQELKRVLPRKK